MGPGRRRREVRKLAREATQRAHAPPAPSPPPAPLGPASQEMACICGQLLRIGVGIDRKRCACPSCRRKFLVTFTTDRRTGNAVLSPVYLDDSVKTGTTYVAEARESPAPKASAPGRADSKEVLPADRYEPPPREPKGVLDDDISPEPPREMFFMCPCGTKLRARSEMYDKRVRCPDCKVRLMITLVYDHGAKTFDIRPVRLSDTPSGDTWPAEHA